jgi:hypothetical protein
MTATMTPPVSHLTGPARAHAVTLIGLLAAGGTSDRTIADCINLTADDVVALREENGIPTGRTRLRRRPRERCTGMNDRWCPTHGDCSCPGGGDPNLESRTCPVHSLSSDHGIWEPFVLQVSAGDCVIASYRCGPKLDSPYYLMYWHGAPNGFPHWSLNPPPRQYVFERDVPTDTPTLPGLELGVFADTFGVRRSTTY